MIKSLTIGSLYAKTGGPALSLSLQMRGLIDNDVNTCCLMIPIKEKEGNRKMTDDTLPVHFTNPIKFSIGGWAFIPGLNSQVSTFDDVDIIHNQEIWSYLAHRTVKFARHNNIPYIVSLRGTLYPEALALHKWKKRIAMWAYQKKDIDGAACVHATCKEEMDIFRSLGFKNPVAILPNPFDDDTIDFTKPVQQGDKFRVGYLGRLHPRKHVERLIYSFSEEKEELKDAELVIIGAYNSDYEKFLHSEVERLGLNNVKFMGFVTGENKDNAIESLSILVVPSDFENFGNIVPEALAHGVPVAASKGMPWQVLEERNCGWWIDNNQKSINRIILKAKGLSKEELQIMGRNGQNYVRDELAYKKLGIKLKTLYEWVLGKVEKPEFVYTV